MNITHQTKTNMIIGSPLAHSLSPLLHHKIYELLNIDAVFIAKENLPLETLASSIKAFSITLTAVTAPYKEKIINHCDKLSPEVEKIGAANTLIYHNELLTAYNTDIDGITFALKSLMIADKNVLIIGAGGAARALAYYLQRNNANSFYLNRTVSKAIALANHFGGHAITEAELTKLDFDLIINTTSANFDFNHKNCLLLPQHLFKPNKTFFDMRYHPHETVFLSRAKQANARIISGIDMFIGQALKQIELFTGEAINKKVSFDALKEYLLQHQGVSIL